MGDSDDAVIGPVDFLVLEASEENLDGSIAEAILDLVDRGLVAIYDLLVVRKDADGSFSGIELSDLTADSLGGLTAFAGARSGLVSDDDLADAAAAMEPGTVAAVMVYENVWARPFVAAARRVGAEVIASQRIPADVLMEALDALEAAEG